MELITILLVIFFGVLVLKLFGALFHASIFLIALPFKILAFLLSTLFVVFVLLPLGVISALIITPLFLFVLPVLIIGGIVILILRNI